MNEPDLLTAADQQHPTQAAERCYHPAIVVFLLSEPLQRSGLLKFLLPSHQPQEQMTHLLFQVVHLLPGDIVSR